MAYKVLLSPYHIPSLALAQLLFLGPSLNNTGSISELVISGAAYISSMSSPANLFGHRSWKQLVVII
jgi:hypothetical protein